jgi:hypothetical protein
VPVIALLIGAASGVAQFWMLAQYTGAVTTGKLSAKAMLCALAQFLLPLGVLLLCGLLLPGTLIWTGSGMAAALVICASVNFVRKSKKK